jgi:hypothetical protein
MVYLSVLTQLFIEWSRLMNNSRLLALFCLLTISLIATGCGGGGGDSPESRSYLPLEVGNRWDYRMTLAPDVVPAQAAQNQIFDYHETVIGTANLQGEEYYIIQSVREATQEYPQLVYQQARRETEEAIWARVGDPAYDLPVLMLPPTAGETWQDPEAPEFTIATAAVGDQVTVPAGTYSCVRVEQSWERPIEGSDPVRMLVKQWFARGVGVVKDETYEDDVKTSMIELLTATIN